MRSSPLPGGGSGRSRPGLRLRYFRVGGNLAMDGLLPGPVMDRFELDAALLGDTSRRGEMLERVQRGPNHVVRVGGAEALGEDVAHAGALQDGAHRPARDDASSGCGGFQKHAPRPVVPDDLMGDGRPRERDLHHPAAGGFDGLAHRLAHLVRLAGGDPNAPLPVAYRDQRVEAEAPAALHDLRDAVDGDDVLDEPVTLPLPLARVAPLAAASATSTSASPTASASAPAPPPPPPPHPHPPPPPPPPPTRPPPPPTPRPPPRRPPPPALPRP